MPSDLSKVEAAIIQCLRDARRANPSRGYVHRERLEGASRHSRISARIKDLRDAGWRIETLGVTYRLLDPERGETRAALRNFRLSEGAIMAMARGRLPDEAKELAQEMFPGISHQADLFGTG